MPTNLNALIRYKQIDACLKNPFTNCSISHLQEICTQSLGENRGVYKQVSERTIRDDIRVLKSDILGFNAPIVFKDGAYYYSDANFSIFSTPLTEQELLKDILAMLMEERKNIVDEEVDRLMLRISNIIGEKPPKPLFYSPPTEQLQETIDNINLLEEPDHLQKNDSSQTKMKYLNSLSKLLHAEEPTTSYNLSKMRNLDILWKDIFALIK